MRSLNRLPLSVLVGGLMLLPAAAAQTVEERLDRLERLVEAQGQVDLHARIEALQAEVRELRGELERHGHEVGQLRNRQRDLYTDADRRLVQLERRSGVSAPTEVTTPVPPAAPQPPVIEPVTPVSAESPPAPAEEAPAPISMQTQPGEVEAYQSAFNLLRELRYDQAVGEFEAFLELYPHGRYAHIAQYWIGEAHYAQRRFVDAIDAYRKLRARHPNSPKLAEALLKIGYSYHELEQFDRAREALNEVVRTYPGTTEAGQAETMLQRMRRDGR